MPGTLCPLETEDIGKWCPSPTASEHRQDHPGGRGRSDDVCKVVWLGAEGQGVRTRLRRDLRGAQRRQEPCGWMGTGTHSSLKQRLQGPGVGRHRDGVEMGAGPGATLPERPHLRKSVHRPCLSSWHTSSHFLPNPPVSTTGRLRMQCWLKPGPAEPEPG